MFNTTSSRTNNGHERRGAASAHRKRASAEVPNSRGQGYESRYGTPEVNGTPGESRAESRTKTTRTLNTARIKTTYRQYSDSDTRANTREPSIDVEESPSIWNPQATLVAHSTAPLSKRISVPPTAATAPRSLNPQAFSNMTLPEQEAAVVDDLLFVLMGFEGQYIRFTKDYKPGEEKSRLAGPKFRLVSGLDPSLKDLVLSMLRMATHYSAVETFIEVQGREECGMVNHALCAAMRKMLKDYLILVAQLEHQMLTNESFTLHVMNLHTKQTGHILAQMYFVANEVLRENSMLEEENDLDASDDFEIILESLKEGKDAGNLTGKKVCKGGAVIRLISKRLATMSGDPFAREVLSTLLRECSKPYMAMLNEWLHHGNVRDPHQEFLIKEQKSIRRDALEQDYTDEYWEKRYTLRNDVIPPQLEAVKDKVLLAGKYLNVVRECGGVDIEKDMDDDASVPHTFDDPRFLENVNLAYAFANSSLLTLLITTHELPARLRSIKHYFFLDRSDFFSYFLELSNSELKKPAKSVNTGKLQSLLDIVLRQPGSVAAEDAFKEDVKVIMSDIGLTGWLMQVVNVKGLDADGGSLSSYTPASHSTTSSDKKDIIGFDALTFDFAVPFPLSLVISRVTLTRYQLLFRYLLSLRHLETLLVSSWTEHIKTRAWRHKSSSREIEMWKRRAFTLRSRMLCFVQQLIYFCTSEVIEPNWTSFMSRVRAAEEAELPSSTSKPDPSTAAPPSAHNLGTAKTKRTVDELMQDHVDFLATCLKECMLTNSKLLRINSKVMTTCTLFADYTASLTRNLAAADPDLAGMKAEGGGAAPGATAAQVQHDPTRLKKLQDNLKSFEDNFGRHLKILLDALNYLAATETVVFLGLCARLTLANEGGAGGGPPGAFG
ncbi:spindle pole body component-like protein 1 [Elsinoe australis]|uniref:Spindle pole body component n=1 Tax=Elsinoe australis TaxID=40998 RepID=A0A4U7B480_9PEZI|nr:spindle pole body component-like protein 1 [Elsinoe australis]